MSMPGNPSDMPVSSLPSSPNNIGSATVKRAPITYKRTRHDAAEDGTGSKSYSIVSDVYSSICVSESTKVQAKTKLSLVPSEAECADDEREDENEQCDTSPKFAFGWKRRLQELDNEDDFTMTTLSTSNDNDASRPEQPFGETPFKGPRAGAEINTIGLKGIQVSLISKEKLTPTDNTLEASPSRSPSLSLVNSRESAPSTPERGQTRWRANRRYDVRVFDSESEPSPNKLGSSTNTSPPLIFQTPNTRSSPTPPTSDDEMPLAPMSKRKGEITRRSVPPLQLEEPSPRARSENASTDKRKTVKRVKAPTKMELAETAKDRARLVAEQSVSIPKSEQSRKFTMHNLFADIGGIQDLEVKQPSDPILSFSSSPSRQEAEFQAQEQSTNRRKTPELQLVSVEKETKAKLQARKQQILALQDLQSSKANVDDDDDLEIVADNTPGAKSLPITAHKKQKSRFRGAGSLVKHASALLGSKGATQKTVDKDKKALTQAELAKHLVERVKEQNLQAIKQKEDEWFRKGGRVKTYLTEENSDFLNAYVRKGLENSRKESKVDKEDDDTEQSAEEFDYGSESPREDKEDTSSQRVGDNGGFQVEDQPADDEVEEAPRFKNRNRHAAAIIDSDSESERHDEATSAGKAIGAILFGPSSLGCLASTDENDENSIPLTSSLGVVHRGSLSSLDDLAEDRSDKENNQKLAFDRSEDKENKLVARHETSPLLGLRSAAISGNNISYGTLVSPGSSTKEGVSDENDQRSPLAVLSEDKPRALQPEPSWTDMFASRPGVLEAYFASTGVASFDQERHASGIAQLEAPSLQPGFSDLFESGTVNADSPSAKQRIGPVTCGPQPVEGLGLTQDILLQPAFDIGNQVLRKAESIFEKEQLILLEAANKKAQKKQFYVNDFGFLTQTRSNDEDFELYKSPLVTQKTAHDALLGSSAKDLQRRPLSTLSYSMSTIADDDDDLADAPRRRLKTRRTPSPVPAAPIVDPNSPTPAPRQARNAFDILNLGHKSLTQYEKTKNRQGESELVVAEAEESDDDDVFGFGIKKKGDDEEDDEDLDRTLETLVDDREMDTNTLAAERVIEKFKEHADHDDQELEKLHQAAVHGELRRKRRNRGIGLDDSDEESDEDERNRRIRRKMSKRQRIDRDNIKALADNEETQSFYKVYEHDLFDDDNIELGYLQQQDVVMNDAMNDPSNEEADREYVTAEEIKQNVRELARRKETEPSLDPRDVSWIDDDKSDEELDMKVKMLCASEKKGSVGRRSVLDDETFEINHHSVTHEGEAEKLRLQSWAKQECKRFTGAGRSGGVAVTGHGKSKVTAIPDDPTARRKGQRKPLKATPSMLAGVSDRSARFG
ncbi:hypothetical protein M378DRAFT_158756 [Amanita muscaria Koide BX008]|uniref:DNA replication checkpoint mediator MRC1 domain-containing protein n=1 Tax=Amanita muscaria (strain Koide BX008) TaxID=946122 RepID=A0A0C2XFK2_AMAMK|nr:hypothetical protein M378DRAFT_158756 [Amanita muscaria Koide BX008]